MGDGDNVDGESGAGLRKAPPAEPLVLLIVFVVMMGVFDPGEGRLRLIVADVDIYRYLQRSTTVIVENPSTTFAVTMVDQEKLWASEANKVLSIVSY